MYRPFSWRSHLLYSLSCFCETLLVLQTFSGKYFAWLLASRGKRDLNKLAPASLRHFFPMTAKNTHNLHKTNYQSLLTWSIGWVLTCMRIRIITIAVINLWYGLLDIKLVCLSLNDNFLQTAYKIFSKGSSQFPCIFCWHVRQSLPM